LRLGVVRGWREGFIMVWGWNWWVGVRIDRRRRRVRE